MKFYTNPLSRGQMARWALHEVGAQYEEVLLEYDGSMKSAEYLAINPMGKVPCIEHEGNIVTEAAAICLYLADAFPKAGLGPKNLAERAAMLRWSFFAAGPLEQAVINRALGFEVGDDAMKQRQAGYGTYDGCVEVLSQHFAAHDYVCGDRFTIADVYVGSHVDWGMTFGSLPERPSFLAYAERLRARSAYKEARAIDAKLGAQ